MADNKPTSTYYSNLGGVNVKASEYSTGIAQFLGLYNFDFDVPNALSKRPGSSLMATGTSGPVSSLFEFIKLDGSSYVVAGTDTAMFYLAGTQGYTLLSSGWNNGQPADMLTFVDRLWIANGQNWGSWYATTGLFTLLPVGLPSSGTKGNSFKPLVISNVDLGASFYTMGGATCIHVVTSGTTFLARGIYFAYSFVRTDGYIGPADLQNTAKNLLSASAPTDGQEIIGRTFANKIFGFTVPPDKGITAIALWVGVDSVDNSSSSAYIPAYGQNAPVGSLGYLWPSPTPTAGNEVTMSYDLKPGADLSRFYLYTMLPVSSLFQAYSSAYNAGGGGTAWATTFTSFSFNLFTGVPFGSQAFSAMPFGFFDTYTPKYIEINQNIMFAAGFSNAPSTVWFSDVGDPETYQPDSNFEVRTNDGDRIFAMAEFQNQLLVFKETSFHKLIGNSAENFELVQVSSEYGCISNRCVLPYGNNIAFLDRKGVVNYNGASWDVISTAVESIFRRMNLSAARENACGVNHIYRNQLWFSIPIDGATKNNITVVYDYLVNAWTYFDGFQPSSLAYIKSQLNVPTVWRGGYSGNVHFFGSSFFSDSGQAITCLAVSRFENFGGQNETSIWRRLFIDVATATGTTGQLKGQVFSNYDQSTVQATFSMYQDSFQTRAEMGVIGKAVGFQVSHSSASLPLLINGYAWSKRPLRNV